MKENGDISLHNEENNDSIDTGGDVFSMLKDKTIQKLQSLQNDLITKAQTKVLEWNDPGLRIYRQEQVSMKDLFSDDKYLRRIAANYQTQDQITVDYVLGLGPEYDNTHAFVRYNATNRIQLLDNNRKKDDPGEKGLRGTLKNEMMHILLHQIGFLPNDHVVAEKLISIDDQEGILEVTQMHIHEFLSDYASLDIKNHNEMRRQIKNAFGYYYQTRVAGNFDSIQTGYAYTNEISIDILKEIFGDLDSVVQKSINKENGFINDDVIMTEMKSAKIRLGSREWNGLQYFVFKKKLEGLEGLKKMFPKAFQ